MSDYKLMTIRELFHERQKIDNELERKQAVVFNMDLLNITQGKILSEISSTCFIEDRDKSSVFLVSDQLTWLSQ